MVAGGVFMELTECFYCRVGTWVDQNNKREYATRVSISSDTSDTCKFHLSYILCSFFVKLVSAFNVTFYASKIHSN